MSGETLAWKRFIEGPNTLGPTPGVREDWHRGRPIYAVWALRVDEPAALERMALARDLLGEAIRPIPPRDAHITLFVVGFPAPQPVLEDDVSMQVIAQQAREIRPLLPLRVRLHGLNSFLTAPFLEVEDGGGQLAALRHRMGQHLREVRFAPYLPHLTVGTWREDRPTAPLAARIQPLRHAPPIPLRLRAVELLHIDAFDAEAPLRTAMRIVVEEGAT